MFEVWNRNENEIVTGQRDKHLDFSLSFYVDNRTEHQVVQLVTVVQINNTLGKVYFFIVKPIHRLLMPGAVRRLCKQLEKSR